MNTKIPIKTYKNIIKMCIVCKKRNHKGVEKFYSRNRKYTISLLFHALILSTLIQVTKYCNFI